ncbi:MAG: HAD family hydrolase [Erysipelotrichaceae bacterium]|nr:HAD family hydrolase [Erysipelotrichaceae bacterium]
MANIIAVVWDFDKTLVKGYMQDPIFEKFNVVPKEFWDTVNDLPRKYREEQDVNVNKDTIYLNHFINLAKAGTFPGLNNEMLKKLGAELMFYDGIPDIFEETHKLINDNSKFREFNIKVEHYVVSTGMKKMIEGSKIAEHIESIWGCELIESRDESGNMVISELGYTIDNTSKTRALFEINKGVNKHKELDVNSKIDETNRRVAFENMIYIADGPSDIPAFSVVNKNGGATFAIYPKNDDKAFSQVEQMRKDGRINMYAEADYSQGTTSYMWITKKVAEFANRIYETEKRKLTGSVAEPPKHIT